MPGQLRLAAADLGYGRKAWQTEEFQHSGQRFLDWDEVKIAEMLLDEASSNVSSDSELIFEHDEANDIGPHAVRSGGPRTP